MANEIVKRISPIHDGKVQVMQIKTKCGALTCLVQKLYHLKVPKKSDTVIQNKFLETKSQYGRTVRAANSLHELQFQTQFKLLYI